MLRLAFFGLNKNEVCGHTQKTYKRLQPIEDSVPGWTWPSENMIQGLAEWKYLSRRGPSENMIQGEQRARRLPGKAMA